MLKHCNAGKHGPKQATREQAEADGSDGEELVCVFEEDEKERGARESDGQVVIGASLRSAFLPPYDGSSLLRCHQQETTRICGEDHRVLLFPQLLAFIAKNIKQREI